MMNIAKLTLALTLFNSWVIFEETVVDRLGWWRLMPCYRVGHFCEWDAAAIGLILALVWILFRKSARTFHGDISE